MIVPLLVMASVKVVTFPREMPTPLVEIAPALLMPPKKVMGPSKRIPSVPDEPIEPEVIVPVLVLTMPPEKPFVTL